jgi:hypothetical protein
MNDVLINGHNWPMRFGVRFELEVEKRIGRTFGQMTKITTEETITMFYIALEVGAKKAGRNLDFSIDQLIDAIDDNPLIIQSFEQGLTEAYIAPKPTTSAVKSV